ncbi:MAG: YIP1 family protein [Gemmobacter sp.]
MAFVSDIVESWRHPARVVRRHLDRSHQDGGPSEAFAFALLLAFLILAFIAQWPGLARSLAATPEEPLAPHLLGRAMAILATIPLWYGLAALGRLVARACGGQGTWHGARIALFWALDAVTPLVLLSGLVAGLIGPGPQMTAAGSLTFAVFLVFWLANLRETERGAPEWT